MTCGGGSSNVFRNALAPSLVMHVRLIEDVDFHPHLRRREPDGFAQLANLLDAAVAGGVDLEHVERRAGQDREAVLARVVGVRQSVP